MTVRKMFNFFEITERAKGLRAALRSFATRSAQLLKEQQLALYRASQDLDSKIAGADSVTEEALAQAKADLEAQLEQLADQARSRASLIHSAQLRATRQHSARLEEARGRQLFELQRDRHAADQAAQAALLKANSLHQQQAETLAMAGGEIRDLMRRTSSYLGGFPHLRQLQSPSDEEAANDGSPPPPTPASALIGQLTGAIAEASAASRMLRSRAPLAPLFRLFPLWLLIPATAFFALSLVSNVLPFPPLPPALALSVAALLVALGVARIWLAKAALSPARSLADRLKQARITHHAAACAADAELAATHAEIERASRERDASFQSVRTSAASQLESELDAARQHIAARYRRAQERHQRLSTRAVERAKARHSLRCAALQAKASAQVAKLRDQAASTRDGLVASHRARWDQLAAEWRAEVGPLFQEFVDHASNADALSPPWPDLALDPWVAPATSPSAIRFGTLSIDLPKLAGDLPPAEHLPLPGPALLELPALLRFPSQGHLVIESSPAGREAAVAHLNALACRVLSAIPPGALRLTFFDPVGLGASFSSLTHLADLDPDLAGRRIWTRKEQFESRLADLNEHVEKVIQVYLRDEFSDIFEYNRQAGAAPERIHFLIAADFPHQFSDSAMASLRGLARSGARCGVFLFLHHDPSEEMPAGPVLEALADAAVFLRQPEASTTLCSLLPPAGASLAPDAPPPPAAVASLVQQVGQQSSLAATVEIPFSQIAPSEDSLWQASSAEELRVPIGRAGGARLQWLALGKGTRQHALFAGKTGSGKSNLFHVIITNLALSHSPDELELYLVDFKKGVEFKAYATHQLPHARVVAVESDREFGLSVLQRVDQELQLRGERFREVGAQDLASFRQKDSSPLPRTLLIIDEFQEFFTEDDRVAQEAAGLLDRIVRQGRAFGIHVLLGSQTLGGTYTLARTTLGQMVVRVALQCNEADAMLIMDEGNTAARLLSRPGEAIYNDEAGASAANSPFQAVFLPEQERDAQLARVAELARSCLPQAPPTPVVFEGNAPADAAAEGELARVLRSAAPAPALPTIWLGAPNSIKAPTTASFAPTGGQHLLVVAQREDAPAALLGLAALALDAQLPAEARVDLLSSAAPGSPELAFFEALATSSRRVSIHSGQSLSQLLADFDAERARRSSDPAPPDPGAPAAASTPTIPPPHFLLIHGLARFKALRYDDDLAFSMDAASSALPSMCLDRLLQEGGPLGIHVIASADGYANLSRALSRKALASFGQRVLFQMGASDSASLIESSAAASLGAHRALLYQEQLGHAELFRPYSIPPLSWLSSLPKSH